MAEINALPGRLRKAPENFVGRDFRLAVEQAGVTGERRGRSSARARRPDDRRAGPRVAGFQRRQADVADTGLVEPDRTVFIKIVIDEGK